jgi:hypothetical protein
MYDQHSERNMNKLLSVLVLGLIIISCASPEERAAREAYKQLVERIHAGSTDEIMFSLSYESRMTLREMVSSMSASPDKILWDYFPGLIPPGGVPSQRTVSSFLRFYNDVSGDVSLQEQVGALDSSRARVERDYLMLVYAASFPNSAQQRHITTSYTLATDPSLNSWVSDITHTIDNADISTSLTSNYIPADLFSVVDALASSIFGCNYIGSSLSERNKNRIAQLMTIRYPSLLSDRAALLHVAVQQLRNSCVELMDESQRVSTAIGQEESRMRGAIISDRGLSFTDACDAGWMLVTSAVGSASGIRYSPGQEDLLAAAQVFSLSTGLEYGALIALGHDYPALLASALSDLPYSDEICGPYFEIHSTEEDFLQALIKTVPQGITSHACSTFVLPGDSIVIVYGGYGVEIAFRFEDGLWKACLLESSTGFLDDLFSHQGLSLDSLISNPSTSFGISRGMRYSPETGSGQVLITNGLGVPCIWTVSISENNDNSRNDDWLLAINLLVLPDSTATFWVDPGEYQIDLEVGRERAYVNSEVSVDEDIPFQWTVTRDSDSGGIRSDPSQWR